MVAVHKISVDFYEDSFDLIALHSSLEDYALGYTLNNNLNSNFKRRHKDLEIYGQLTIPVFEWKDDSNDRYWTLFTNKGIKEGEQIGSDLFKDELSYTTYRMVPEYREVDYFLKIEQDNHGNMEELVKKLLSIPKIITAYVVETDGLKSKNNLIF